MKKNLLLILLIILFGSITRLIPHPPNFTPILSMFLFSGVYFGNKKLSVFVPILSMLLSDLIIGFGTISLWVYLPLLLITLIGHKFKNINIGSVLTASFTFFVISNFGVWLMGYPKTIEGLISCYVLAIPFFTNTLISTFAYSFVMKYLYQGIITSKLIKINVNS